MQQRNARSCQNLRSFDFLSRGDDYRGRMRDRVDGWVDWRRDNIWCHFDGSRRSNLLGWLDKGLPAMLQTSEIHCARMQTLRQHTRLDGARASGAPNLVLADKRPNREPAEPFLVLFIGIELFKRLKPFERLNDLSLCQILKRLHQFP
jgi:hypothetical protein